MQSFYVTHHGSVRLHAALSIHILKHTPATCLRHDTFFTFYRGGVLENHLKCRDIVMPFNFVNLFLNVRVFLTGKLVVSFSRFSCYSILKFRR